MFRPLPALARRLDVAEDRAGPESQGDPAPMLLSPDGTRVAVGDHDTRRPDLLLVDLTTGDVHPFPLPRGRSALPLAWSPDGRRLAYLTTAAPDSPYSGTITGGDLGVLDIGTGVASPVPGASAVVEASFSPDGALLAVQRAEQGLTVVAPDGTVLRTVDPAVGHRLDGPNAWSPDGALLATSRDGSACADVIESSAYDRCVAANPAESAFVDASGAGAPLSRTRYSLR